MKVRQSHVFMGTKNVLLLMFSPPSTAVFVLGRQYPRYAVPAIRLHSARTCGKQLIKKISGGADENPAVTISAGLRPFSPTSF
jgi:hypothetical protein